MLKKIVIFLVGVVIGAGIGSVSAAAYTRKSCTEKMNKDMKELKDFYESKMAKEKDTAKKAVAKSADTSIEKKADDRSKKESKTKKSSKESEEKKDDDTPEKISYPPEEMREYEKLAQRYTSVNNKKASKPTSEDTESNNTVSASDESYNKWYGEKKPYRIDEQTYLNCEYEAKSLWLYRDNAVTNENDELVNVEELLGVKSIKEFGEFNNSDSIYICDDKNKVTYEVCYCDRNYFNTF